MNKPKIDLKTHKSVIKDFTIGEFELNTLNEWIKRLHEYQAEIPPGAIDPHTYVSFDKSSYYDSVDVTLNVRLSYFLPYTEEEIAERERIVAKAGAAARAAAKRKQEEKERKEREEFLRLKAKYGE